MKNEKKTPLPEFLRQYFWDVAFEEIDSKKNSHFIIKRVLDRGNLLDIRWLLKTYDTSEIKKVVMTTRDIARPTGNFWADLLDINKKKVPCLQKPYFPIHFGLFS